MIIAGISLAALTVFLLLFHSIRKTAPHYLLGAAISLAGAAFSFGLPFTSNLGTFEISAGITSIFVTLFASILLMRVHLKYRPEMQPIKVDSK